MSKNPPTKSPTPMTAKDASRIQSATAHANDGAVPKNTFAARAQSSTSKPAQAQAAKPAPKPAQAQAARPAPKPSQAQVAKPAPKPSQAQAAKPAPYKR